jgi:metal-dependent amidase/aminoacylase/carboxypeptidase family protein
VSRASSVQREPDRRLPPHSSEFSLLGRTLKSKDEQMRNDIHRRSKTTAEMIAKSVGVEAKVTIAQNYRGTINYEGLTELSITRRQSRPSRRNERTSRGGSE